MFFLFQKFFHCLECYFTGTFSGIVVITSGYAGESLVKKELRLFMSEYQFFYLQWWITPTGSIVTSRCCRYPLGLLSLLS